MSRIYVTDCEGPLTRNDNAQELAARFIPDGAAFFARLSRYDDFLADVARKPGYNAGDTLRLLAPFLLAHGVTDAAVIEYSAANVLVVPGAAELLAAVQELMPAYIISTSYTPYIVALSEVVGFPFARCRCTTLSLDAWELPPGEAGRLRDVAAAVSQRPVIGIPEGARSIDALSAEDRETVHELDTLFWETLPGTVSGELLAAVRPVGGGMKLAALEEIVSLEQCGTDEVMYVGDSITDAPPLSAVRDWGGASVSFNGNGYALAAAEFACAAESARPLLEPARAFAAGGSAAVRDLARARITEPDAFQSVAAGSAAADDEQAVRRGIIGLLDEDRERLTRLSALARRQVRGQRVARLG